MSYIDQYNVRNSDVEANIVDRIERHVEASRRDWMIKMPMDIEESLNLSVDCLKKALFCLPSSNEDFFVEQNNLLRRLANVCNEIGVLYMNQAR